MKIAIVYAEFNEEYTHQMLEAAKKSVKHQEKIKQHEVFSVPGTHEIPVITEKLLSQGFDGAAVLGAVIEGATDHDKVIAHNVSKQLQEIMCKHQKPVGLGIIGPGVSWSQVEERTDQYAEEAVEAAAKTQQELNKI
jgi:6,7-dimethyl-8-ribityllumazine synthase